MDLPGTFKDVAPFLQQPLVLVGFVTLLFFGILTALLKTGVFPSLPKKTVADVVKRILNYGFIIAILIILLGFWEQMRDVGNAERTDVTALPHDSARERPRDTVRSAVRDTTSTRQMANRVFCNVTLHIPSELSDAEVLVDGRLADIIRVRPTSILIRMEKKMVSQRIVLRNSSRECSTRVLVEADMELSPCL